LPLNQEPANSMERMAGTTPPPPIESQSSPITPLAPHDLIATLGNAISTETKSTVEAGQPQLRAALVLGSPDFMRR
jgi:hypothetical protein